MEGRTAWKDGPPQTRGGSYYNTLVSLSFSLSPLSPFFLSFSAFLSRLRRWPNEGTWHFDAVLSLSSVPENVEGTWPRQHVGVSQKLSPAAPNLPELPEVGWKARGFNLCQIVQPDSGS